MKDLSQRVHAVTPRCLSLVTATPTRLIGDHDCIATAFVLLQKSGSASSAQILGFPLAEYNPACQGDPDFISPLRLRWSDATESLVFDSEIHGYHGEMDSSAKLRGIGNPKLFACTQCGHDKFTVTAQFDYWDACEDLLEDEPDIPVENYFCNVLFAGSCRQCNAVNEVLNMDL